MTISDILRHKHDAAVATIAPGDSVEALLASLAEHNIGALVVVERPEPGAPPAVVGIVSERDVVRRIARDGTGALSAQVQDIMTSAVVTCDPDDAVEDVAATMTDRRIRHMPVLDAGNLVGIVSIGDVVSSRIRELELVRGQLEQYIAG